MPIEDTLVEGGAAYLRHLSCFLNLAIFASFRERALFSRRCKVPIVPLWSNIWFFGEWTLKLWDPGTSLEHRIEPKSFSDFYENVSEQASLADSRCLYAECNVGLCLLPCFQQYHTLKIFTVFSLLLAIPAGKQTDFRIEWFFSRLKGCKSWNLMCI